MPFKQFNGTFADLRKGDAYAFGHSNIIPANSVTQSGAPSFGILTEDATYFSNWDGPELIEEWSRRAEARGVDAEGVDLDAEICIIRFEQETH